MFKKGLLINSSIYMWFRKEFVNACMPFWGIFELQFHLKLTIALLHFQVMHVHGP